MPLPLAYNVRSVRERWPVALLAIGRHRPRGGRVRRADGHVAGVQGRAAGHGPAGQRDRREPRLELRGDLASWSSRSATPSSTTSRPFAGPDGRPLASWEWVSVMALPRKSDGRRTNVVLRPCHAAGASWCGRGSTLTAGRLFTPGLEEVVVGRRILDRVRGLELGRRPPVPAQAAPDRRRLRVGRRRLRERGLGRLRNAAPGRRGPGLELARVPRRRTRRRSRPSTAGSALQPEHAR